VGGRCRGRLALLKDVGTTLKDARRNLTRSRQRIVNDLEQIEQALVKGKAARPATPHTTRRFTRGSNRVLRRTLIRPTSRRGRA
jgi:hypothetical protein